MNTTQTAADWIADRAAKVLPAADLASFLALSIRSQLIGIATFAVLGGDVAMMDVAMEILATVEA